MAKTKIKRIFIYVIPHKEQRYDTVGDWFISNDTLYIKVSDVKNDKYHLAVAIHEIIETLLCMEDGVKEEIVSQWDTNYENMRKRKVKVLPCGCKIKDEPGDDKHAPYHKQHQKATQVEKFVLKILGAKWKEYNKKLCSL